MKRLKQILWGVALVALGVILGLNALEITHIDIFFDGWWTLFLIIPGVIGLFTERDKTGNLVLISIGCLLLLACQDQIGFGTFVKLAFVAVIILTGLKLLCRAIFGKKTQKADRIKMEDGRNKLTNCFSSERLDFSGREFEGAELTAVFGGIECDLRHAIFTKDVTIEANAVFAGVTILLPANVDVKINASSFCGGVTDSTIQSGQMFPITVFVKGNAVFGGVQVK